MCIELCAYNARRSAWRAMKSAPPDWKGINFFWANQSANTVFINIWAEIHQALLSQFSLLVDFLIGKVPVKD